MTTPNPADPADPTEAAKRIKELAEEIELTNSSDDREEMIQLAPILADAWLARPKARRLRWKRFSEAMDGPDWVTLPSGVISSSLFIKRDTKRDGRHDQRHELCKLWDFERDEFIAIDLETGEPAPVGLEEVES